MKNILLCSLYLLLATATSSQANQVTSTMGSQVLTSQAIKLAKPHFVQFFSSRNPTKAEGMKNTLKLMGFPAFVFINIPKQSIKPPYYQVQVGPFPSKDVAIKTKNKVVQQYPEYQFLSEAILKTAL